MTNKTILRALLLLIMLTVSPITLVAQNTEDESEEERLDRIVSVYFVGCDEFGYYDYQHW